MDKKTQVAEILKRLKKAYTDKPRTVLRYSSPFELLVATVMSAQTTDVLVNRITEKLFKKYRTVDDFALADPDELAQDIKPVNFFHTKAKNVKKSASMIVEEFKGEVPRTMDDLIKLPGVARKTANIVLSSAFGINEGIAVDTHVKRLAYRLGLTKHEDPVKIEQDLLAVTPKQDWGTITHLLIFHGRTICIARKPKHDQCVLFDICPSRAL